MYSRPQIVFVVLWWALSSSSLSLLCWRAQNWTHLQVWPHQGQVEAQLPQRSGHAFPGAPQDTTGPPGHKGPASSWTTCDPPGVPCPSPQSYSVASAPGLCWHLRVFLPRCRTRHLPLLNLLSFSLPTLQPIRVPGNGSRTFRWISHSLSLVPSDTCWGYILSLHLGHW